MSVLARRLKDARQQAGLSQERLGIDAGLDPMSASTRMNRYELGKRVPDIELMERIAGVLKMPVAYFYAGDEDAEILLKFHVLSSPDREKVLTLLDDLLATGGC